MPNGKAEEHELVMREGPAVEGPDTQRKMITSYCESFKNMMRECEGTVPFVPGPKEVLILMLAAKELLQKLEAAQEEIVVLHEICHKHQIKIEKLEA